MLAGCAGSSGLATTREYYRDAQLCRSQNLITSKVKANIGNVSATELKTGVDTTGYLRCLAQRGWTQQAASDPLLVALAKCHDRAERPARATRQQGTTRLGASLDRTAFQECLRQRGVQGGEHRTFGNRGANPAMTAQDPPSTAPPEPACPLPSRHYGQVVMAHGGGGRLARELLETLVQPAFANPYLAARHDSAVWAQGEQRFAFTTDSYVVKPLFFPGGDIGKLAVCGTLNDLAMAGARPLFLSAALILEEGLPLADLQKILESMAQAARAAGTWIVTGDTKVVDRGKGDGLYVNTAGVGLIATAATIAPSAVRPGDAVLLSGDIGRHGIAVLAHREGLAFETALESDCADLSGTVLALLEAGLEVHCLRDLTRGGLAGALFEIAHTAGLDIHLQEPAIAVPEAVRGPAKSSGWILCTSPTRAFHRLRPGGAGGPGPGPAARRPLGAGAAHIGQVVGPGGTVQLETAFGVRRVLDLPSGEPLPRIC